MPAADESCGALPRTALAVPPSFEPGRDPPHAAICVACQTLQVRPVPARARPRPKKQQNPVSQLLPGLLQFT